MTNRQEQTGFKEPSRLKVYLALLFEYVLEGSAYRKFVNSLGLKGDEWVIDYGSGTGAASKLIAQCLLDGNGHLTCVDISRILIDVVRKRLERYPNVDLKLGDIISLDVEDNRYNAVVIHYVLHDIPRAERQEKVNALSRKLKKGGRIFIEEPVVYEYEASRTHGMHLGAFLPEEIRGLMTYAGLTELSFRTTKSLFLGTNVSSGVSKGLVLSFDDSEENKGARNSRAPECFSLKLAYRCPELRRHSSSTTRFRACSTNSRWRTPPLPLICLDIAAEHHPHGPEEGADSGETILGLYEADGVDAQAKIRSDRRAGRSRETDLLELDRFMRGSDLKSSDEEIYFRVGRNEIRTIHIQLSETR